MKKALAKRSLVLVALMAVVFMFSIAYAASYNGLCSKCGHEWTSASVPTKCPKCGNTGITYNKTSSVNTTDGSKTPLCAANNFVAGDKNIILAASCIEKGLQCTLNGTPYCGPYECKGKFPNTYCQ